MKSVVSTGSAEGDDRTQAVCAGCGAAHLSPGTPCPECGAADPDATVVTPSVADPDEDLELIRSALGTEYEIIEELGRGGMAVVYRARERSLDRDVAIKVLPVARTFDAELVARFQREARTSASLEHPHIVPIYRVGQKGRINFFVMKYLQGLSLADVLEERGRLEGEEVERLLLEVGEALARAHERGIVHRDVKPDNVIRDEAGRYVVMDFGIAKSVEDQRLTQAGGSIGTPKYMSPEQAKGADLDGRSDFYSLGVVAYHCLAGRVPFEGEDALSTLYSHLHDPVPEPELATDEERRVYSVVRGLLTKEPERRIHGIEELRAGLRKSPGGAAELTSRSRTAAPVAGDGRVGEIMRWLRLRPRSFWIAAVVGAVILFALVSPDAATGQCRAALPDPAEDDRALLIDPVGLIEQGAQVAVTYTVCGLPDSEPFEARLSIRPADNGGVVGGVRRFFGGGNDPVRVTWSDQADGFATARERTIAPGELEPGAYRMTIRIEESGGRETESSHEFTIVER